MIYGLNFNRTEIPLTHSKPFHARLSKTLKKRGVTQSCHWMLQGVADSLEEARLMKEQAWNGRRKILIMAGLRDKRDKTTTVYAVYCG